MQKLLVDENLSPSLVGLATDKGFVCSHVNHLGLTGQKDWQLKATILDGDWTFITNNGVDFRGSAKKPGSHGVYAGTGRPGNPTRREFLCSRPSWSQLA